MKLKFGAETQDWIDDIAFALAGAYDATAIFTGSLHASLDFELNYKINDLMDGIVHGLEKSEWYNDQSQLIKHGIVSKDLFFMVSGVPVDIHRGCNIYAEEDWRMLGEAALSFGAEADMDINASATV